MSPQIELARVFSKDKLASQEPGDSGASEIGISSISGLTATQVQQALEALKTYTDEQSGGSHIHDISSLPVANSGETTTTKVVRADDSRLSDSRAPTTHTHTISDLPVAASEENSATKLVRADDARITGARVPSGGLANQVLKKTTGADFDMTWANESGAGGSGVLVQEEGSGLVQRPTLNFIGGNITATDDSANNRTNITLASSYATVQDEGAGVTARQILDFRGADVTVTDDAAGSRTRVTVASSYPTIQEEGTNLTSRPTINIIGGQLTAADDSVNNRTNITVAAPTVSDIPQAARTKDILLYNSSDPLAANQNETGEYAVVRAGTIIRIVARVSIAPVGAAITVSVKKNGSQVHSMSIAAGSKTTNSSGLSLAVADGDYLTVVPTTVGSTTPGSKLSVLCEEVVS